MKVGIVFFVLLLVGCGGGSGSPPLPPSLCSAHLQWVAPIERLDGTALALSELAKFTIYVSESPDPNDMQIELVVDVVDVNLISWEIQRLKPAPHWFWVTATDTEGRESANSNIEGKDCSVDGTGFSS